MLKKYNFVIANRVKQSLIETAKLVLSLSLISRNAKGEIDKFQTEANIDEYIGALIDGVRSGDFDKIKDVPVV